jgi:hypothetical protein
MPVQDLPTYSIPLNNNHLFQSGYINLQAAGSTGADGSAKGIHLRWDILRELGENHFPKGNLAESGSPYYTTQGYNKDNDFVRIFRADYDKPNYFPVVIDFSNPVLPANLVETSSLCAWRYPDIIPVSTSPNNKTNIEVRFIDITQYNTIRATINPSTHPQKFIKAYNGLIEVETTGKLMFAIDINGNLIDPQHPETAFAKIECISTPDSLETDDANKIISFRKTYDTLHKLEKIYGENIKYFRFLYNNSFPKKITLETYVDFIIGVNDQKLKWSIVGNYSLSDNDTTVFTRLEDPANYVIDKKWAKFNDSDAISGACKVKVDNYKNRWNIDDGLKEAVIEYLTKSATLLDGQPNLKAIATLPSQVAGDGTQIEISYLDMLRVVSLDFHAARMLGLGCIDPKSSAAGGNKKQFVYVAGYLTEDELYFNNNTYTGQWVHLYMTLPTSRLDYRLPPVPELDNLSYGITIDNGTPNPAPITDPNGYSLYDIGRYINIHKKPYPYEIPYLTNHHNVQPRPFFDVEMDFNLGDMTRPILYGLEYRANGEVDWRRPELSNDEEYIDYAGLNETVPIIEQDPVYTHKETENGFHDYALYGINLFSRVSIVSNFLTTDETIFEKKNTMLPPLNLAVQLIQKEDPLIFTTPKEQLMLDGITSDDKTLVRITFDWNHNHNLAYQKADRVEFLFRDKLPANVQGKISNVIDMNDRVQVETQSFIQGSLDNCPTIQPIILDSEKQKFIGGYFSTGSEHYVIEDIIQPNVNGYNPSFILLKNSTSQAFPSGGSQYITSQTYIAPVANELFLVVENMGNTSNWDTKIQKQVELADFSPLHIEPDPDNPGKDLNIGGIYEQAKIDKILDNSLQETGFYKITFNSYVLDPPLQPITGTIVDWYKGIVRIKENNSNAIKTLDVFEIRKDGFGIYISPLEIIVFDPTYSTNPIIYGTNKDVNFHPSYRVYLYYENSGSKFNDDYIFPVTGEGTRQTIMTARSADTTTIPNPLDPLVCLTSYLAPPVVLNAREIVLPSVPVLPVGPLFATRPDFYGKSTYTFDTKIIPANPKPFAMVFFRANEISILNALYTHDTIYSTGGIIELLKQLSKQDFDSLMNSLIKFETDNGAFKTFGGYGLPLPNNDITEVFYYDAQNILQSIFPFSGIYYQNYYNGAGLNYVYNSNDNKTLIEFTILAINAAFLPLTEQPVIYDFIQPGYQTLNKKPLIRNENSEPIVPSMDPTKYHQAPMTTVYTDTNNDKFVRFTDYTLDGASSSVYFYCAAELANNMVMSDKSPILGPISLVNAMPPGAPEIKKVTTQLANPINNVPTAVIFEINKYIEAQNIKKYRIYRALNTDDAKTIRTMVLTCEINEGDVLQDTFSDLQVPPYGDALFYRIIAFREILNERNETEYIPSQPSNIAMTNVVDVINPEAPTLSFASDPLTTTPPKTFNHVVLSWNGTAYNGTYYLYKMNQTGNWQKIYKIKSNDNLITVNLADTDWQSDSLVKEDSDGNTIYHRFKVGVENVSGLLNLKDKELTI